MNDHHCIIVKLEKISKPIHKLLQLRVIVSLSRKTDRLKSVFQFYNFRTTSRSSFTMVLSNKWISKTKRRKKKSRGGEGEIELVHVMFQLIS